MTIFTSIVDGPNRCHIRITKLGLGKAGLEVECDKTQDEDIQYSSFLVEGFLLCPESPLFT